MSKVREKVTYSWETRIELLPHVDKTLEVPPNPKLYLYSVFG